MRKDLASFSEEPLTSLSPVVIFLYMLLKPSSPSAGNVSSAGHADNSLFTRPIVSSELAQLVESLRIEVASEDQ